MALLAALGVFFIVAIPTRYVSLGSIVAAISFPLFLIFVFHETSTPVLVLGIFASIFIVFTHRNNIERLLKGEENKFAVKQKSKKHILKILSKHSILILLIGFYLISIQPVNGQSSFRNESKTKANAAKYFAADQFNLAFPLYSQLLSLDTKNPELNYHFGVCLMYTERSNTEEPIAYLEKAINKVTDIDLYYHLGLAYHNNYFFTDAIYNYCIHML